ncbi:hypothetical protein CLN94_00435 [Pseudothioclava arenosa]|uniref:DUF2029 domain-containing protein n=2 Tax=Pseudothioclava arenosa TaxID=1795308 RepID=A0A2A4CUK7_9RHOB|nr:hypothetical protein CLN94_00435 [Pseudothioclava arenosa]
MSGMKRPGADPLRLFAGMALWLAVLAGLSLWGGVFIAGKHEGDTLHLADMVLRMAEAGQIPHFDFMTPLGILAIWPIAALVKAGQGLGMAFLLAQLGFALVLFVPILRVALSRFPARLGWLYAAYVLVLCVALVHGEGDPAISASMHYNRWAWALAYVAVPLAMLEPAKRRMAVFDGVILGLALAAMALIKATYFAAFLPAVLIALLARRDWVMLGVALASGLAVVAAGTLLLGVEFWFAYLRDLLIVASSKTRAAPGLAMGDLLVGPTHILATFTLMAAVIFLRQSGRMTEGLVLLLLVPAFVYVTYQNFGNDPQWLMLLALLALSLRPAGLATNGFGWRLRTALTIAGVIALSLGSASAINMALSPLRLFLADPTEFTPFLSQRPAHDDLLVSPARVYRVSMSRPGADEIPLYSAWAERAAPKPDPEASTAPHDPTEAFPFNGEPLPVCELGTGYNAWFESTAEALEAAGHGGARILIADLFSSLWLYGDFPALRGGAPWYYAGTPGIETAEFVLVPLCPTNLTHRNEILSALDVAGWQLDEVMRTETFILTRPHKG